jgi:hypothetical protein
MLQTKTAKIIALVVALIVLAFVVTEVMASYGGSSPKRVGK